jgi:hypothetical protein
MSYSNSAQHGCSITTTPGTEGFTKFYTYVNRKQVACYQYDYRDIDGELFSCVRHSLDTCRALRDAWLADKACGGAK